MVVVKAATAQ